MSDRKILSLELLSHPSHCTLRSKRQELQNCYETNRDILFIITSFLGNVFHTYFQEESEQDDLVIKQENCLRTKGVGYGTMSSWANIINTKEYKWKMIWKEWVVDEIFLSVFLSFLIKTILEGGNKTISIIILTFELWKHNKK